MLEESPSRQQYFCNWFCEPSEEQSYEDWRESLKNNEAMEKRKKKQREPPSWNFFVIIHLGVVVISINVRVTISII